MTNFNSCHNHCAQLEDPLILLMSSSLSSVVSNLVRASMGTSISNMVTDDDLDRHVAELIVKEAKRKAERYGQQGIRAYISSDLYVLSLFIEHIVHSLMEFINIEYRAESNVPRTNKRFLTSIIKSTDDHNKTVLKAQAAAAQELKRERDEQERRERRARAAEAAEAEKLRRRSKRKRDSEDEYWDRWDGRTADRKRASSSRNWDDNWSGYEDSDRSRHRRRRTGGRPRSRSKDHSSRVPSHHSSPSPRSRSREPSSRIPSRHSSPSPGPQPPVQLPSKMDRYFEESYDPRLDVAPLSAPKVPATGLINNAEFEGWDAMLELIRVRKEDKEEKKRLERWGLSKEKVKVKKNVPISSSAAVADRWSSEGVSVLDIEYKKRGSVREWDVGKEL